jgi:hypothetical protein
MKKTTFLKALFIAIPIASGIFAQYIENKSNRHSEETIEKTNSSDLLKKKITIASLNH